MNSQDTAGHPVEILCWEGGKSRGRPMAVLVLRPHPEDEIVQEPVSLLFTQEQCMRLRNSLHEFLCRKDSWLYLPRKDQEAFDSDLTGFAKRTGEIP